MFDLKVIVVFKWNVSIALFIEISYKIANVLLIFVGGFNIVVRITIYVSIPCFGFSSHTFFVIFAMS